MTDPATTLRAASKRLRDVAPQITGPLAGLADPVADWLDSWTATNIREDGPMPEDFRHALTIARKILGEEGDHGH